MRLGRALALVLALGLLAGVIAGMVVTSDGPTLRDDREVAP